MVDVEHQPNYDERGWGPYACLRPHDGWIKGGMEVVVVGFEQASWTVREAVNDSHPRTRRTQPFWSNSLILSNGIHKLWLLL